MSIILSHLQVAHEARPAVGGGLMADAAALCPLPQRMLGQAYVVHAARPLALVGALVAPTARLWPQQGPLAGDHGACPGGVLRRNEQRSRSRPIRLRKRKDKIVFQLSIPK